MGLDSFVIQFDNPNKIYSPGNIISGRVVIDLNSVKKLQAISIKYKGKAKTQWNRNKQQYVGKEIYIDSQAFLDQGVGGGSFELQSGKHSFDFSFVLPPVLPSSFTAAIGKVKYSVTVTLDRPWKFDHKIKNEFFVVQPIDLNQIDFVKKPATLTIERDLYLIPGGIYIKVYIPCSGFICGQTVPIVFDINNASKLQVSDCCIRLKNHHVFYNTRKDRNIKIPEGVLLDNNVPLRVTANSSATFMHNLTMPSVPLYNLRACQLIDHEYKLKFKFNLSGFHPSVKGEVPVVLGHVPLTYISPMSEIHAAFPGLNKSM